MALDINEEVGDWRINQKIQGKKKMKKEKKRSENKLDFVINYLILKGGRASFESNDSHKRSTVCCTLHEMAHYD